MQHLKAGFAEAIITAYLLERGYNVFKNVTFHGPIDLIAWKEGNLLYIDSKYRNGYKPSASASQQNLGIIFACLNPQGGITFLKASGDVFCLPEDVNNCSVCHKSYEPTTAFQRECSLRCKRVAQTRERADKASRL